MTINQPNAQRTREILRWLEEEHPDPEVQILGRDMRATFDYQGVPGKKRGKRWFQGALLLAEALMQQGIPEEKPQPQGDAPEARLSDAEVIVVALEEQSRRRQAARCYVTKKVIFESEEKAKLNRGKNRKTDRLRVYLCEHCHGWHLTSDASNRRKRR